jgi:SAM-dependent methyltransferase
MKPDLDACLAHAERRDGVYYLTDPAPHDEKEMRYWRVRARELRLYPDDVVRRLPDMAADHPLAGEWKARADSLSRLANYLARIWRPLAILDLGCGNGWLSHQLAAISTRVRVYGLDLNRRELAQAARVFVDQPRVRFLYADVFAADLPAGFFDIVILASVIQYFPDVPALIRRLFALAAPGGEVHVIDSPLYADGEVAAARERTSAYYRSKGLAFMAQDYHHHPRSALKPFHPEVLYDPRSPLNRLARWWWSEQPRSPFEWLKLPVPT